MVRERKEHRAPPQENRRGEGHTNISPPKREPGNYADNRSVPIVELTAISISTKYLIL